MGELFRLTLREKILKTLIGTIRGIKPMAAPKFFQRYPIGGMYYGGVPLTG